MPQALQQEKRTLHIGSMKSSNSFALQHKQNYTYFVKDTNPIHKSIRTLIAVLAENISRTHSTELWDECVDELIQTLSTKLNNKQTVPERCKFFGEVAHKVANRQKQDRYTIVINEN